MNTLGTNLSKRFIATVILAITPLSSISIDMYAPSLPTIAHFFHISATLSKTTITLYLIGFGLGQIMFGCLSDSFGRKNPLFFGTTAFAISSLVIALIPNLALLLTMRILQGITAASVSVSVKAMNADLFEGSELVKITTYYSAIWSACLIFAPLFGSYIQHYFSWQANFYFFALFGGLSALLTLCLPETSNTYHKFSPLRAIKNYAKLLSHKQFLSGSCSIAIGFTFMIIFSVIGPFLIIRDLKYSVIFFGHVALLVGIMTLIGSFCARILSRLLFPSTIVAIAISLTLVASITYVIVGLHYTLNLYALLIPIFCIVLADSVYFPTYFSKIIGLFPHNRGSASASIGVMLSLIPFIATLIVSLIPLYTLLPVTLIYLVLSVILFLLYIFVIRPLISRKSSTSRD